MHTRLFSVGIFCLAVIASPDPLHAEEKPPADQTPAPAARPDYTLQAADLIRVQIFQEPDLLRDVRVSQEYTVTLPLIGTINLKGMTVREVGDLIQKLYDRDYLVDPQVSVMVLEYAARTVNVLGAVNKPGNVDFPLEQQLTLMDAIARAGGFSRVADRNKVRITRQVAEDKTETHVIDANEIIEGHAKDIWQLQKNDVIYVPERIF